MSVLAFAALWVLLCAPSVRSVNNAVNATLCPLGYGQHPLLGRCALCPNGTFGDGGVHCNSCGAGQYSDVGASICVPCGPGAWSAVQAAQCHTCPDGYQVSTDATHCAGCGAGQFSAGGAACRECAVGLWSPDHASHCYSCPRGQWQGLRVHPDVEACRSVAGDGIGLALAAISSCSLLVVTWWIVQEFVSNENRSQRPMRVKFLLNVWVAVLDQLSDSCYFLFTVFPDNVGWRVPFILLTFYPACCLALSTITFSRHIWAVFRKHEAASANPGIYRLLFTRHYSLHMLTLESVYLVFVALITPVLLGVHAALASAQLLTFEPVSRAIHRRIGIPGSFAGNKEATVSAQRMSTVNLLQYNVARVLEVALEAFPSAVFQLYVLASMYNQRQQVTALSWISLALSAYMVTAHVYHYVYCRLWFGISVFQVDPTVSISQLVQDRQPEMPQCNPLQQEATGTVTKNAKDGAVTAEIIVDIGVQVNSARKNRNPNEEEQSSEESEPSPIPAVAELPIPPSPNEAASVEPQPCVPDGHLNMDETPQSVNGADSTPHPIPPRSAWRPLVWPFALSIPIIFLPLLVFVPTPASVPDDLTVAATPAAFPTLLAGSQVAFFSTRNAAVTIHTDVSMDCSYPCSVGMAFTGALGNPSVALFVKDKGDTDASRRLQYTQRFMLRAGHAVYVQLEETDGTLSPCTRTTIECGNCSIQTILLDADAVMQGALAVNSTSELLPSSTPSPTPSVTASITPTGSITRTPSTTASETATTTVSSSATASISISSSVTPSGSITGSISISPSVTSSGSPSPSPTASVSLSASVTSSSSLSPSMLASVSVTPSFSMSASQSLLPTLSPSLSVTPSNPPVNGGVVSTLAGGIYGFADATGSNARFAYPRSLLLDASGNVLVVDTNNNCIRKVSPAGGVTVFVGSPAFYGYVDAAGSNARFYGPTGIAIDSNQFIYTADYYLNVIRKTSPAGDVTTYAGQVEGGWLDATGTNAKFLEPTGVAADAAGNIYVTELTRALIRKITPAGVVTTIAGGGSGDGVGAAAGFSGPFGLAASHDGTLYIADASANTIRKITPAGVVSTLAGAGVIGYEPGTGTNAKFHSPLSVAVNTHGLVYVSDSENQEIRAISPDGVVTRVAGLFSANCDLVDGTGINARFCNPNGIWIDTATESLYVSDSGNSAIRKIV